MPVHNAYARITPFELLLPDEGFAEKWFPLIREEAEGKGGRLDTPESFVLLSQAAMALREIRGEDDGPELIQQHAALLYQAFHFWENHRPLLLLDTEVARYLVESGPGDDWRAVLPGKAGYLQLPHHLFWSVGEAEDVPESLDGLFWSSPDGEDLTLLLVMGMRKDRPGLAVVPLPTLPLTAAAPWASMAVRPDGDDFRSFMPGAELEGLYSVASGGEVVKLAMRVFWYLETFPGRLAPGEEPTAESLEGANAPEPSGLPYRRVVMGAG